MDLAALRSIFEDKNIRKVKVGGFDVDGILRGKLISLDKFWSAAEKGFGFCDVIFGWDVADQLYDNASVTGWHSGYPDAHARIDLSTFRVLPSEPDTACFLASFYLPNAKHRHPACPRGLLERVVSRAEAAGYRPKFGVELEFWIFQEEPDTLAHKDFRGLTPLSPGNFGYSWLRTGQFSEVVHDVLDTMSAFDIDIEGLHTETGPGVWEVALTYCDALEAADRAALFKTTLKQVLSAHGLSATFMAKWNAQLPGSSGHLHQSLMDSTETHNLFFDPSRETGLTDLARHYIGGQVRLARELTALYSPFINTYKRYVPGVWAPLTPSWGIENRTCAVRVVTAGKATRVEYRQTAADINPYIAIASNLAAGMWGIEHAVEPPAPTLGDATTVADAEALPGTLAEANRALAESEIAPVILGEAFVDHYVRTRDWEIREYQKAVTDWELRRYFEAV